MNMLQTTPRKSKNFSIKKITPPSVRQPKLTKQDSFKSSSSRNSKSPGSSTQTSQTIIKYDSIITQPPKIKHPDRRQTFTVIDQEKQSPRIQISKKGKSMTKLLPIFERQPIMRKTVVSKTFRGFINQIQGQYISDYELQKSQIRKLDFKLRGFNIGEKGFDVELQKMISLMENQNLIDLCIHGDKDHKLRDIGVAQLIFNFQNNGKRIVCLDLKLNWNEITDIGVKHIGNGLTYLINLRSLKLNLGHNKFGSKSASCLAQGIKSLIHLKHLEIDITNYGDDLKMMDEGVNTIIQSFGSLKHLRNLKFIVQGQQITTQVFDSLLNSLSQTKKLASIEIDMDFGRYEEYLGIQAQKLQQLLDLCPNLVNLKISRISLTQNTKLQRSQFFLKLFKQEFLNQVSIQFTNGYQFLNSDANFVDFKKQLQEKRKTCIQLIGFKHVLSKHLVDPQIIIDDLYDVDTNIKDE
ncbi:hypothetical protein TTHERM_00564360 (macronuclear) [Tetrahymena thermophila SB210]|uniref:Kinase domain protein n=1 Tax=Tetrahymena thermophila (strain SB210) TaxID=312017 RepID=I7LWH1_TETTS|nr:hypothetical protein TTHERM_00564360 [Tetrahymena thermophila SB210]EAS01790.2 hypothetical protein TTHERM_00564360 [Tetrahymena thermophila SB210]|eukprot:XP_001022035.2 hypothetical protein TTHERM_00564360 [Tetrahymena thermophila SB210]